MTIRDKIVSELTQLDARKARTDRHWNRHFIGIALQAMDGFEDDAAERGPVAAFCERFTACREMHGIARRLGFAVDVQRGQWITR